MSDTAHAKWSPSASGRWMACPGSMALEAPYPNTTSKYAEEGTAAHELAAWTLESTGKLTTAYLGRLATNRVKVTQDMCDHVQTYVDNIMGFMDGPHRQLFVEERVQFGDSLGVPDEEAFGTSDCVILTPDELQVHDLKYGMGVKVDAEENEQLLIYALGVYTRFGLVENFERVRLVIHQPRLGHISEWTCSISELLAFGERVKKAVANSLQASAELRDRASPMGLLLTGDGKSTPILVPGEHQCKFCKAKASCPAQVKLVKDAVGVNDFEDLDAVKEVKVVFKEADTDAELGVYMSKVDLIEDWCKAVRAETESRLLRNIPIPGYKLVEGKRGARAWANEDQAEEAMKKMRLKQNEMYSFKVISPTQAEKVFKENPRSWKKLQSLITQSDGKPSVAPVSDKRPAWTPPNVNELFEDLTQVGEDLA